MIRQRKTTRLLPNGGRNNDHLPRYHTKSGVRIVRSGKSSSAIIAQWSRFRRPRSIFSWLLFFIGLLLVIIVALDRIWVSISLGSSYPNYKRLAKAVSPTGSLDKTNIAIVSIHEGFKFHGSLGQFLRDSKRSYAGLHGYAFIDESFPLPDDDDDNNKLPDWMKVGNRKVYYKKLRLILFLLEKYHNLDWVMLIDGDAIVTQPYISIEDRLEEFKEMYLHKNQHEELSFVWAADSQPNSGVLLVRNVPVGREYLKAALNTWEENDFFKSYTDQSSLIRAAQVNQTFSDSALLLEKEQATLMQSRVRGPTSGLWRPGHWILHLPNHNYLELLSSLRDVGRQSATSPPPILRPIERPSLESLSRERRNRFEQVQAAIRHAWRGYADVCLSKKQEKYLGSHIPLDDLSPVSGHGHDWLYHAATVYDSLDTLALAFGVESNEYKQALQIILQTDLQASALRPTKTFEYSLRILGGLLGAFSITGDARLLSRARDAADALIQGPFASSPTALPRMFDVLYPPRGGNLMYKVYSKLYEWGRDVFTNEHHYNSLAGVGSFSLEFVFLSQMLGTDKYRDAADNIFQHVQRYQGKDGTIPSFWNVMTGEPVNSNGGLGSGSDSFVEYLLKVPLLSCNKSVDDTLACDIDHPVLNEMLQLYHQILNLTLQSKHTVTKEGDTSIAYPVDNSRYHQLLCFLPGLIALEPAVSKVADGGGEDHFALATSLVQGCHDMYHQSPLGLGPEELIPNQKVNPPVGGDMRYLLRPEYAESLFVMYRRTGNRNYQEMGWEVFQRLERFCKTDLGYAGVNNVYKSDGIERIDDMPSYFISETLKYLLLLFGPDDFLSLDATAASMHPSFVFTTEAHPLRRLQGKDEISKKFLYFQTGLASNKSVQAPFPWLLTAFLAVAAIFIVLAIILTKKIVLIFVRCVFILYRHTMLK